MKIQIRPKSDKNYRNLQRSKNQQSIKFQDNQIIQQVSNYPQKSKKMNIINQMKFIKKPLELAYGGQFSRLIPKKFYQDKQRLYSEAIELKNNMNDIVNENIKLKTKISMLEKQNEKMKKRIIDFNINSSIQNNLSNMQNSNKYLKNLLIQAKNQIEYLKKENLRIKKSIKYTQLHQIQIQKRSLMSETLRLRQIIQFFIQNSILLDKNNSIKSNSCQNIIDKGSNRKRVQQKLKKKQKKDFNLTEISDKVISSNLKQKQKRHVVVHEFKSMKNKLVDNKIDKRYLRNQFLKFNNNQFTNSEHIVNNKKIKAKQKNRQAKVHNISINTQKQKNNLSQYSQNNQIIYLEHKNSPRQKQQNTKITNIQLKKNNLINIQQSQTLIQKEINHGFSVNKNIIDQFQNFINVQQTNVIVQSPQKNEQTKNSKNKKGSQYEINQMGKNFQTNKSHQYKKQMLNIKQLLTYRFKNHRYTVDELKRDIIDSGHTNFEIQQIQNLLTEQPFLLTNDQTKLCLYKIFDTNQLNSQLTITTNTFINKLSGLINTIQLINQYQQQQMFKKINSILKQNRNQLIKHFKEKQNDTIDKEQLINILRKFHFHKLEIQLVIGQLSHISLDLQHLNFFKIFQIFDIQAKQSTHITKALVEVEEQNQPQSSIITKKVPNKLKNQQQINQSTKQNNSEAIYNSSNMYDLTYSHYQAGINLQMQDSTLKNKIQKQPEKDLNFDLIDCQQQFMMKSFDNPNYQEEIVDHEIITDQQI